MAAAPRILVVDDEPKICEFLETLLHQDGYVTDTAPSGDAALEKISSASYDLIISDLKMPGIDGFELAKRVKVLRSGLPIVIVTGYATVGTAIQALRQGVDDYVTKPFKIDEMRKVISRVLEKSKLEMENRRLVAELAAANEELKRHRAALADQVKITTTDLECANADLRLRVHELAVLNEVGACAASALDVDKLLAQGVRVVAEKLGVTKLCILLREGDWLVTKACQGPETAASIGGRIRVGTGTTGRAAASFEPLVVTDMGKVAEDEWLKPKHSLVCVPIIFKQDNLGVMCATDKRSGEPFTASDLRLFGTIASQIAPAIENARLYRKLEDSSYATVRALVAGLEAKDPYLHGHALRVTSYALAIGAALGMKKQQLVILERAGQLHDIGKLGISDVILNKPSRLTPSEFESVKMHPVYGEDIIKHLDFLSDVRPVIRHHHERIDGRGYPDGKKGDEIELLARILSVADAFDAMTSPRSYRPAKDVAEAQREISSLRTKQFDSVVADAFCDAVVAQGPQTLRNS